jgi:hypothetical protein
MNSWVSVKPTRKTEPPACLPYLGFVHVDDPSFDAAEVILHIVERVEADFPKGVLRPLAECWNNPHCCSTPCSWSPSDKPHCPA